MAEAADILGPGDFAEPMNEPSKRVCIRESGRHGLIVRRNKETPQGFFRIWLDCGGYTIAAEDDIRYETAEETAEYYRDRTRATTPQPRIWPMGIIVGKREAATIDKAERKARRIEDVEGAEDEPEPDFNERLEAAFGESEG